MPYTKLLLALNYSNVSTINTTFASANATYTFSATNVSFAQAMQTIQNCALQNGVLADSNNWYPMSSIIWILPQ